MLEHVKYDNSIENEIIQRILFSKGYMWGYSKDKEVKYLSDDDHDIILYDTNDLVIYRTNTLNTDDYISFNEFIDMMDEELNIL